MRQLEMSWALGGGPSNRPDPTDEDNSFICNGRSRPALAHPAMDCGSLGFLGAPSSYNFDYGAVLQNLVRGQFFNGIPGGHLLSAH